MSDFRIATPCSPITWPAAFQGRKRKLFRICRKRLIAFYYILYIYIYTIERLKSVSKHSGLREGCRWRTMNQSPGHLAADCASRYLFTVYLSRKRLERFVFFSSQVVNSFKATWPGQWFKFVHRHETALLVLAQAANGMPLPSKSGKDSAFCLAKQVNLLANAVPMTTNLSHEIPRGVSAVCGKGSPTQHFWKLMRRFSLAHRNRTSTETSWMKFWNFVVFEGFWNMRYVNISIMCHDVSIFLNRCSWSAPVHIALRCWGRKCNNTCRTARAPRKVARYRTYPDLTKDD